MTCVYVCVSVIRGPGRLPQEIFGSSGGSYTKYPSTTRWSLIKTPIYIYIVKITFMVVYQLHNSQAALYSAADKCRRASRGLLGSNQVNSWLVSQVLYHSHHCCGTGNCIFQPQTPQCVYDERLLSPLWNPAAQISMKPHCLWLSPKLSCC